MAVFWVGAGFIQLAAQPSLDAKYTAIMQDLAAEFIAPAHRQ
jgi:hypothetical protein